MVNSLDRRPGGTLTGTAASHRDLSRHACPDGLGRLAGPGQAPIREALALALRTDGAFFDAESMVSP